MPMVKTGLTTSKNRSAPGKNALFVEFRVVEAANEGQRSVLVLAE